MSSRPTLLLITLGDYSYRGLCLQQVAAAYDVVVVDSVPPTSRQRQYISDFEIADLHNEQALLAAGRALAQRHALAGVMTWTEWMLVPTAILAEHLGLPCNTPEVMLACRSYATPLHPSAPAPERPPVPTPLEVARRQQGRAPALRAVSVPRWSTSTTTQQLPPPPPAVAAIQSR